MLRQEFQGKTGLVKFQGRQRTGTRFEIMRLESKESLQKQKTSQWIQVGSATGGQVVLENTFWKGISLTDTSRIKVVTCEVHPFLSVSTESVRRARDCILDYPCVRYVSNSEKQHF